MPEKAAKQTVSKTSYRFFHQNRIRDKEKHQDSITAVNQEEGHGVGIWGNPRVPMTIRIDKGIKEASKPVLQAIFGSVCLPTETFYASIISAVEAGNLYLKDVVNHGNTVGKEVKIDIRKIVIERNLRPRRRLQFTEPEANMYDPKLLNWVYVSDAILNGNGHAVGCACKVCRDKGG